MNKNSYAFTSTTLKDVAGRLKLVLLSLGLLLFFQNTTLAGSLNRNLNAPEWSKYDHFFRKYTQEFFGAEVDWRLFKTQAIIESNLEQDAKSTRGAVGVMQIVPTTFRELQKNNEFLQHKPLHLPEWNIAAGICYNKYLYKRWNLDISNEKRITLMLASYNAGYSRVKRAFNRAGKPAHDWSSVAQHIPNETRNYLKKINKLFRYAEKQTILAENITTTTL